MIENTINIAGVIFTARDIIITFFSLILFIVAAAIFLVFTGRKAWRFFSNVQKPILFLNLTKDTSAMSFEAEMAERSGFLSRPLISNDPRQIELVDKHSLVVIGVNDDTSVEDFTGVYNLIKTKNKPVVIFTLGERETMFLRTAPQSTLIKSYSLHTISTTPLRLISDIFAILSMQKY